MMYSKIIIKNRPAGVSLLIAIIFVAALLLVTGSMAETHWSILQHRRDWDRYQRAKSVSESIAVLAAGDASDHEAGWNTEGSMEYNAQSNELKVNGNVVLESSLDSTSISKLVIDMMKPWYFKCQVNPNNPASEKKSCVDFSFNYEVLGRPNIKLNVPYIGDYYVIPSPRLSGTRIKGTGNLPEHSVDSGSKGCEWDVNNDGQINQTDYGNADNPCHWNVLSIADDPHQIPFFYDDGTGIKNPADSGLTKFMLRIRARCPEVPGLPGRYKEWCTDIDRYTLYSGPLSDPEGIAEAPDNQDDDVLVHWQFTGTDKDPNNTGTYTLQEYQDIINGKRQFYLDDPINNKDSTITASRINKTRLTTNIVLEDDYNVRREIINKKYYWGKDNFNAWGPILNFLKNEPEKEPDGISKLANAKRWFDSMNPNNRQINQPYLLLEMVNRARWFIWQPNESYKTLPQSEWRFLIPSLEYQILTDKPIADSKKYIKAQMTVGETTQSYVIEIPVPKLTQSFTLQN